MDESYGFTDEEVTIDFPEMTADEAEYFLHNENGVCGCFNCDTFRERIR